jgi:DNA-binding response OmpR family regulator
VSDSVRRVAVLADDLIWASRLVAAVERAGAIPIRSTRTAELDPLLADDRLAAVVVDLGGRTYDGVEAVRHAADAGRPVLAVGQHEDLELRKRALAAGARRVYSYNKLFRDGPRVFAQVLEGRL